MLRYYKKKKNERLGKTEICRWQNKKNCLNTTGGWGNNCTSGALELQWLHFLDNAMPLFYVAHS